MEIFESNPEITEAVEAVYSLTKRLDRGGVLTHEAIGEVLGLAPHEGRWDHVVNRVRDRLEKERGISTKAMITVGYELLTPAQQLELPSWRLARAIRQVRRGRKSVQALPEKGLTAHQRRLRQFNIDRSRDAERSMRRDMAGIAEQLRPTVTQPRRAVMPERAAVIHPMA